MHSQRKRHISSAEEYRRAALSGSITGLVTGASGLVLADAGLLANVSAGFGIGFTQEAADSYFDDGEIDWGKCISNGVFAAAMSGIFYKWYGSGGKRGSGAGNNKTNIDPKDIRFSQSSVNGSKEIIESMKKNGWKGDPIDVVQMPDGVYTTIDNTRVISAREAGINVQASVHGYNDPLPTEYIERFTTKKGMPTTWGEAVELRVGKQKASFRNDNPYGTFNMDDVK